MPVATTAAIERIERHIERIPESGCWVYTGALNQAGYGWVGMGGREGGSDRAHRVTYRHYRGEIPVGMDLDHLCRVRSCCNPYHLEAVTRKENSMRGDAGKATGAKNRAKTHCAQGHEFTDENTYWWRGHRGCRICRNKRSGGG